MRWFLIYYVIGLIYELADLALRWNRGKKATDSLAKEFGEEPLSESSYTALIFGITPITALFWPIGVMAEIFPGLIPEAIRKHMGK